MTTNLKEYQELTLEEKIEMFHFDYQDKDNLSQLVFDYLDSFEESMSFNEKYEEYLVIEQFYERQQTDKIVDQEIVHVLEVMDSLGMSAEEFDNGNASARAKVFRFEDMEYSEGVRVYRGVLDKLGLKCRLEDVYGGYAGVYEECLNRSGRGYEERGR